MLNVNDLSLVIKEGNIPLLKKLNLDIMPGEVHAIMGTNGSGKSTFAKCLIGHPDYQVTAGVLNYTYCGEVFDLNSLEVHERAHKGIFLAFQYPIEIPGVSNEIFLRESVNEVRKANGKITLDPYDFAKLVREKMKLLGIDESFLQREVNGGLSGGEKKKNEILQMLLLEPQLAILDESDSGLDIDALRMVAAGINHFRSPENAVILITHYQRLLNYVRPDFVHIMHEGAIIKSGGPELALQVEDAGYDWLTGVGV
ncbi:MAG: Fe-S cluster assembly ATPase SufC [Oligoflexia bacterium]|nr:Fe-S cluster assembly ATPase SufC [Oligoflexia bacterium]